MRLFGSMTKILLKKSHRFPKAYSSTWCCFDPIYRFKSNPFEHFRYISTYFVMLLKGCSPKSMKYISTPRDQKSTEVP